MILNILFLHSNDFIHEKVVISCVDKLIYNYDQVSSEKFRTISCFHKQYFTLRHIYLFSGHEDKKDKTKQKAFVEPYFKRDER